MNPLLTEEQKKHTQQAFYRISFDIKRNIFFPVYTLDLATTMPFCETLATTKINLVITRQREGKIDMCYPKKEWDAMARHLLKKLQQPPFFAQLRKDIKEQFAILERRCDRLESLPETISPEQAIMEYRDYLEELVHFRVYAAVPNMVSLGEVTILEQYRNMLSQPVTNDQFTTLTTAETITSGTKAEKELLQLMQDKKTDDASLHAWQKKWGYIYYYYLGPVPGLDEVKKMIAKLKKSYPSLQARLDEIAQYGESVKAKKQVIKKTLPVTPKDLHLLEVISYLNFYKAERKERMQKSYVACDMLFERLKAMTDWAIDDLKMLTVEETEQLLANKGEQDLKKRVAARRKELLTIVDETGMRVVTNTKAILSVMDSLKLVEPSQKLTVACMSPKPVRGRLIVINTVQDMEKIEGLQEPFILASNSTYPDLLPAMSKCVGMVTRVGGLTSHAAIVSREMHKPCIVGYKNLFEDFAENDYVELDTQAGKLRKVNA